MATASYTKAPPALSNSKSYGDWKKLIKIWKEVTSLDKSKQALALVLSLEGEAQDAALQIESTDLSKDEGVDILLNRLDKLYNKYISEKYAALEAFETYRRPATLSIRDFMTEFDKRYFKIKSLSTTMSDDLLAYRLLKAANLSSNHEQLVKATVTDLNYDEVKNKLTKIFSDESTAPSPELQGLQIKQETFHTAHDKPPCDTDAEADEDNESLHSEEDEVYYADSRKYSQRNNYRGRSSFRGRNPGRSSNSNNWRTDRSDDRKRGTRAKNPPDRNGRTSRCSICDSGNHWVQRCPDRTSQDNGTYVVHEIVLHQTDLHNSEQLKALVAESWSSGLLDCGASKTVCGDKWLTEYINSLPDSDRPSVTYLPSNNYYRFGDGERILSHKAAKIPAFVGHKHVFIITNIISKDLPLLLSKEFMKRANMVLDFTNDTLCAFDQTLHLETTNSGHYTLPLTEPAQLLSSINRSPSQITLTLRKELSNHEIAVKLHRQFAHPTKQKLTQLIKQAGEPWRSNEELKREISSVTERCDTCLRYKRSPPLPIVGLPMVT